MRIIEIFAKIQFTKIIVGRFEKKQLTGPKGFVLKSSLTLIAQFLMIPFHYAATQFTHYHPSTKGKTPEEARTNTFGLVCKELIKIGAEYFIKDSNLSLHAVLVGKNTYNFIEKNGFETAFKNPSKFAEYIAKNHIYGYISKSLSDTFFDKRIYPNLYVFSKLGIKSTIKDVERLLWSSNKDKKSTNNTELDDNWLKYDFFMKIPNQSSINQTEYNTTNDSVIQEIELFSNNSELDNNCTKYDSFMKIPNQSSINQTEYNTANDSVIQEITELSPTGINILYNLFNM